MKQRNINKIKEVIDENMGYPGWTLKQIQESLKRVFNNQITTREINKALEECAAAWNNGR